LSLGCILIKKENTTIINYLKNYFVARKERFTDVVSNCLRPSKRICIKQFMFIIPALWEEIQSSLKILFVFHFFFLFLSCFVLSFFLREGFDLYIFRMLQNFLGVTYFSKMKSWIVGVPWKKEEVKEWNQYLPAIR
jgi:hypothetical protein